MAAYWVSYHPSWWIAAQGEALHAVDGVPPCVDAGGCHSEVIRRDIEIGVAAALDEPDLRQALGRVGVTEVPDDQNDIDLIVMLVPRTHGGSWPFTWRGSDTFAPYMHGYIVAAIQALDMAAGRPPRPLKTYRREWLDTWAKQSGHELG